MALDKQPPAKSKPEPALLALAREKFGALSRAEEELFRAAQEGRAASAFATGDEWIDNPADAADWPAERVARAECISWVCTDPQASALVSYLGLKLFGMRIDGEVDLGNADIKFQFLAWKCAFSKKISLWEAQLQRFYLADCQIKSVNAARAVINGSVIFRRCVNTEGEVNLEGIRIGGDLDCSEAQFFQTYGVALNAYGAQIKGSVSLREAESEGEVNLLRATIGGDLDCLGAQFRRRDQFHAAGGIWLINAVHVKDLALYANNAKIEGSIFLRKGFKAEGVIDLSGAIIGGSLDCDAAQFSNAGGLALNVNGTKIEGSVFLRDGFNAKGKVDFGSARIGSNLECDGAQFSNANGLALNADGAKIDGGVFLHNGFRADGEINLVGATIGGGLQIRNVIEAGRMTLDLRLAKVGTFWDDENSWPEAEHLFLDGFCYERFHEEAPFEADSRKKWLSLQPRDKFRPQPYDQLSSVLNKMGHAESAWQVFIAKDPDRARHTRPFSRGWWWYNVFGKLIGYGYRPGRAFRISLAMILLGTLLFHLGSTHHLISPTSDKAYVKAPSGEVIIENGRPKISKQYPVFKSFVYSLESFTPLLKLDQSANWAPNANHGTEIPIIVPTPATCLSHFSVTRTGSLLRYYLYLHIASGWLLTSLWVGAITGLVKT